MKNMVIIFKKRKLADMIIIGFSSILILVFIVIVFREKSMNEIVDLYNSAMIYNSMYSESYLNVTESEALFEEYAANRKKIISSAVIDPLSLAQKQLVKSQTYSYYNNKRKIRDLERMIDTCIKNINIADEQKQQAQIKIEDYYKVKKIYRLIFREFEKGWGEQLQLVDTLRNEAEKQKESADIRFVTLLLVGIAVISLIVYLTYNRTNRSIREIIAYAEELKKGNLEIEKLDLKEEDEFRPLVDALNSMVIEVRKYILLQKRKNEVELNLTMEKLQRSEMENQLTLSRIKELQSKMNPHFLFNTLNMISCTAFLEDAKKTHKLMEAMGILLRYNIDQKEIIVEVEKEAECISQYVMLQQERFEDRIMFHLEIDKKCLKNLIPALTIQPLVENAVIHGVKDITENGIVEISIYQLQTNTIIEVRDNGCGIGRDKLQRLLTEDGEGEGRFGLKAVFRRLRLIYGKDCGIIMESELGHGTKILIKIPIDMNTHSIFS